MKVLPPQNKLLLPQNKLLPPQKKLFLFTEEISASAEEAPASIKEVLLPQKKLLPAQKKSSAFQDEVSAAANEFFPSAKEFFPSAGEVSSSTEEPSASFSTVPGSVTRSEGRPSRNERPAAPSRFSRPPRVGQGCPRWRERERWLRYNTSRNTDNSEQKRSPRRRPCDRHSCSPSLHCHHPRIWRCPKKRPCAPAARYFEINKEGPTRGGRWIGWSQDIQRENLGKGSLRIYSFSGRA